MIVEDLDVVRNILLGFLSGRVHGAVDAFVLQRREERFSEGVVPADPGPAEGLAEVEFVEFGPEFGGGVLGAVVGGLFSVT